MEGGRIRHDIRVELPRSRTQDVRYSAAFNAICAELRQAMDQEDGR